MDITIFSSYILCDIDRLPRLYSPILRGDSSGNWP